jgi:mono/diheme cytochrome c family protein/thiol-disulfide isomerase/thioredoxin
MNHVMASNQTRSCSAGRAARISGAVSLVLASGCWLLSPAATRADTPPAVIGRVPLTAADAADMIEAPSILIDAGGTLHATWVSEMASGERTVFVADAPAGEPLSQPRMVARTGIFVAESTMGGRGGPPRTVRRPLRTAPHIMRLQAGGGESLVVVFTAAAADDAASVRPLLVRSDDGGRTFSEPAPLGGATAVRPTFTGCGTAADGRLLFSWLDHRLGVQVPALAATRPGETTFLPETLLEESVGPRGVCPCCPTACAADGDGTLFLAYRNQLDGFRDIHVARRKADATRFAAVAPVVPKTWQFDGCPHDGPSLDVHAGMVTVAWMDAHEGVPLVYVATSRCDLLGFSEPVRLDPVANGAQGNVRLARDPAGALHAVWERSAATAVAPPVDAVVGSPHRRSDHGPHIEPGGRLIVHSRQVNGGWTAAEPIAPAGDVMQTRPVLAVGRDSDVAAAFFERTATGKSLVVLRSGSPSAGIAVAQSAAPRPALRMPPGKLAYLQHCAGCHGATGGGDGPAAAALPQPPRAFAAERWRGERTVAGIRRTIMDGLPGTAMKPLTDVPDATVDAIVAHVAELAGIGGDSPRPTGLRVHSPPLAAVELTLDDTAGDRWTVPADATLTLVHVWSTSCGVCLAEMPGIESLGRSFADRGLHVVHLCMDAPDATEAGRIGEETAPSARVLVDPSGRGADQLGARLLPATRIIDRRGRVVASVDGREEWDSPLLRRQIEKLLTDAAPSFEAE